MTPRIIAMIVGAAIILLAVLYGPAACQRIRGLEAQGRMNQEQGNGFGNSAADAVGTVGTAGRREAESEDLTRRNERDIMAAEGARDPVNPATNRAGRNALCKREAYRNHPDCKGQRP